MARGDTAPADDSREKAALSAVQEGRKQLNTEKQKLIASVFDKALETLLSLEDEQYLALLCQLTRQAASDSKGGQIMLNAKDKERFGQALLTEFAPMGLTLCDETANIAGGVVIRRGKIEINCALEEMIRSLSDEKSFAVASVLFG